LADNFYIIIMTLISVHEAYQTVMAETPPVKTESVPLAAATGRILAESVMADRDYPPINRATMDGITISLDSWRAGVRLWKIERKDPLNNCAQIMTGAEAPENCSGILPFELVAIDADHARLLTPVEFIEGQHIHVKSSDRKAGDMLLKPGITLDAPRIAILAAVGHAYAQVAKAPRVAVLSTGNEIVPVDQKSVTPTQVRASNSAALIAALRACGVTEITDRHLPDDPVVTLKEIREALEHHDIIVLSGGVSKGKFDYVPDALRQAGVRNIFHNVAQKPGKPFWFGKTDHQTIFGLPGNPVSTLTVFQRYAVPFIHAMTGVSSPGFTTARITQSVKPHPTLTTFPPVLSSINHEAVIEAASVTYHGSGDFAALAESSGFLEVPAGNNPCPAGTIFPYYPW
jgi:molybdopterin molybdotransferase